MFDIGFSELLLLAVVSLLVLGPERLPGAVRTATTWINRIRRSFNEVRSELERELNANELKQDLHNHAIIKQLEDTGKELNQDLDAVRAGLQDLQFDIEKSIDSEPSAPPRNTRKTNDDNP
jgi:sec-independent protein translocase protein TatB